MRKMRRSTKFRLTRFASFLIAIIVIAALLVSGVFEGSSYYLSQAMAYAEDTPITNTATTQANKKDIRDTLTLDPEKFVWEGNTAYQYLEDGKKVELTLVKELQDTLQEQLDSRKVPHGGVVAIEPSTGRVLAMVSASYARPGIKNYALRAVAPSASVFKLITAAALLEMSAFDVNTRICYSGGSSFLSESDVKGNPGYDKTCNTLEEALGHSINAVMARLAYQHLSKEKLETIALKFGFNREIPFEIPIDVSEAEFVDDDIERARTAAGFWHVNLSPFHGALLSAAIANNGIMMRPTIVQNITDPQGNNLYHFQPQPWLSSMSPAKANELSQLAENTTTQGPARKTFTGRTDWPKELRVSGKTGTLSNKVPYYLFTWFVGWAPIENPDIAVGALVTNTEKWWIKGTHVGARAILSYYRQKHPAQPSVAAANLTQPSDTQL